MKRTPIKRRTAMNRVNKKRKRKRAEDGKVYGPYHRWISKAPCLFAYMGWHRCGGKVRGHHVRHVGNGGEDYGNEVPLCDLLHKWDDNRAVHKIGRESFEAMFRVNLRTEALRYAKLWDEREGKNGSAS